MLSVILESYDLPATSGFAKVSPQILLNLERDGGVTIPWPRPSLEENHERGLA